MIEATCTRCGETFNPDDEDDLEHIETADGAECGGVGTIVGEWRTQPAAVDRQVDLVVRWACEARDDGKNDHPGMPLTQLPLAMRDALHMAKALGVVAIVERPATVAGRPSSAHFVVPLGE